MLRRECPGQVHQRVRSRATLGILVAAATFGSAGCKGKSAEGEQGQPKAASPSPSAPATERAPSPGSQGNGSQGGESSEERARKNEAAGRALLDAWLAAQNAGDFAAYEALYAQRFTGIKRVDARSQRFDRSGFVGGQDFCAKAPRGIARS